MSYQDIYTRYHDKPTTNGSIRSNNGWIYSAYSKYLAPDTMDHEKLVYCYNECFRNGSPLKIDRSPNDLYPVLSKDEVIGVVSLALLNDKELEANHWNFCNLEYTPEKLTFKSVFKAIKALYKIRNEHRNYVWENEIVDAYPLAFYLAPFDQYYVKRFYGKSTTLTQTVAFYLNFISTFYKGNKSVRMMLWLQCEDMNHFLLRFIPKNKWVRDYFSPNHPFVKNLK